MTLDENWLQHAKQATDYSFDHFYDEKLGFFRFTSNEDAPLITSHFETEDNVIPASNSVMGNVLHQLSIYFNHPYYRKISDQMVRKIVPSIDYPSGFSNWLYLFMNDSEQNKELAICGTNASEFINKINGSYFPNLIVAGAEKESQLPFLKERFVENETLFYVCQNQTCLLPTTNLEEVLKSIL